MSAMNVEEQAGVAIAVKKLVERRFTKFMNEMEEIKKGFIKKEDFKKFKDMRRDQEKTALNYEEIITCLESVYAEKVKRKECEMKAIVDNFQEITKRKKEKN